METDVESARSRRDSYPMQFISAFMVAIGMTALLGVGRFVLSQPTSVLRFATSLPSFVGRSLSVGFMAGAAAFMLLRWANKSYLAVTVTILVLGLSAWFLIQVPPLRDWLLPEVTTK